MTPEELRPHIETASLPSGYQARQLTSRIVTTCWPGGADDHVDRAALEWLRLWRPRHGVPSLPACSCAHGHCAVCN